MKVDEPFDPEEAIRAARTGNTNAVAKLIERYRPYLRLLARVTANRRLQSKIDESDVGQEASLLAARDLPQFRGDTEQELAAWLRRVLTNVIANTHRHYARDRRNVHFEQQLRTELDQSSAGFAQLAGPESSPSQRAMRREQSVILAEALDRLPDDYSQVLMLRELEGFSLADIAEKLGRTRNSVQKLWARAITEMRRILKEVP